jgi:formyltetrahydrofolate deformylase
MLSFARRPLSAAVPSGNLLGIHLFQCPDAVGIVAKLSECIASRGGNIHSVDVFVPDDKPIFYSRRSVSVRRRNTSSSAFISSPQNPSCLPCSEFTYNPRLWPRNVVHTDFVNLSSCFNAQHSTVRVPHLDPKYKISVLASKQVSLSFTPTIVPKGKKIKKSNNNSIVPLF